MANFGSMAAGTTARNIGSSEQIRRSEEERQRRVKNKNESLYGRYDEDDEDEDSGGLYGRFGESKKYDW